VTLGSALGGSSRAASSSACRELYRMTKKTVSQLYTVAAVVVGLLLPFSDHAYTPRQFSLFHNSTRRRGTRDYSVLNFLDIRIELRFNNHRL